MKTKLNTNQISKDSNLSQLAASINELHAATTEQANRAIESARNVGGLLNEAKQQVPHGQWITWLSNNCSVSPRQAQRYMKVADNWTAISKNDAASYLTITSALAATQEISIKDFFDASERELKRLAKSAKPLIEQVDATSSIDGLRDLLEKLVPIHRQVAKIVLTMKARIGELLDDEATSQASAN